MNKPFNALAECVDNLFKRETPSGDQKGTYMATQDTTVTVENGEVISEGVETTKVEDETSQGDNQEDQTETGNEQDEDDSSDDTGDSQDQTEDNTNVEFKKRFTQLKGETPEEYLKNLEDAYANSSTEGQRLNQRATEAERKFDQIAAKVANDPEFAEKLASATDDNAPLPTVDPALAWAKQKMEEDYAKDYKAFADSHPEIVSDTEKYNNVVAELDVIAAAHEARGSKLTMAEGLRKAWISLGYDEDEKKEKIVDKVKNEASSTVSQSKPKSAEGKQEFTEEQIKVAAKMGLSPKQLAEYNK